MSGQTAYRSVSRRYTMDKHPDADVPKRPGFGARHKQALMTFLCLVVAYSLRVNLSVGIVAMTDKHSANPNFPELPWDPSTKGAILSSFFWGYLVTQVPAGQLARKFGPKYLLFVSLFFCGVVTVLTPFAALHGGSLIFCLTRIVQGLLQGCIYPSINTHMAKWAPPLERSRIFSFVFSGTQFGTVITLFVAGFLAASPGGWPSIYYVTGLCGVLWALAWLYVGADSPATHTTISQEEKHYIETLLIHSSSESSEMKTPWKEICTSVPLWALLITHCGQNWGFWTLLTQMPSYMSHVLGFDIKSNGLLSALPYLSMWILTIIFAWIADYINERQLLSLNYSRKMWNTIAHWGGAIALLALAVLVDRNVVAAVTLLTIAVALNCGAYTGFLTNHLDLSPNFAGLLMGITNGFSNITSILGPLVSGFIVTDEKNASQWKMVFYISALIFFLGNLVFIIFGSTEVQPWNQPVKKDDSKEEANKNKQVSGHTNG